MNAALLLEHYAYIADAPDAIPRLRQFVLDLAVRGKLVEQDGSEEPASTLLNQIEIKKAKLPTRAAKVRPTSKDAPFPLPSGWCWTTIGEICSKTGSGSTPRGGKEAYKKFGIPFVRSQNVYNDGLRLTDVAFIDVETHNRMASTAVEPGDLLLNITGGSLGRCCRVPDEFDQANVSQHVAILRLPMRGPQDFLHLLIRSPYFQACAFGEQTGAGRGGLPKNRMDAISFALPPLAEQKRIVGKVDEMMSLCDQIEAARAEREAARNSFALSTLAAFNKSDPETFGQHANFALTNLSPLTARADQIKQLRQTIFNLALRGKLVEQDAAEQSATELLEQIAAEKARLVRQKVIKKSRVAEIEPEEAPYPVPANWQWCRLGDIGDWGAGSTPPRGNTELYGGGITWLKSGELNDNQALAGSEETVTEAAVRSGSFRLNEPGDVLIAMYGATIGKLAILAEPAVTNQAVCGCTPFAGVANRFLFLFLLSQREHFHGASEGGAQPNISKIKIINTPIPIPPADEQHRIIAKVDELIAVCDQLESILIEGEQSRSRLLETVLHNALEPA